MAAIGLLLTLPAMLAPGRVSWRGFSIAVCLLLFAAIAAFQTLPLPSSILTSIAGQSAATYQTAHDDLAMTSGLVANDAKAPTITRSGGEFPISVAPWLTKEAAAWFAVLAAFGVASSQLFVTRHHITVLLIGLALTGALQAGFGIYQMIADPTATVWGIKSYLGGSPFGSYVTRSSAAVIMNLGLASGLGLVAWRLAAITGASLYSDEFPFSELLDVVFDRLAMIGISSALMCVAGLLACGSRGGLVGSVGGLLLAFGLVQTLHRGRGLVPVLLGVALMAAILLVNFDLSAKSVDRLQETPDQVLTDEGIQDGRLDHWKDGWQAAIAQPLLGWGLGAYRYAYLPFQHSSAGSWFVNADNLWLEWFVEAGIVGVLLAITALVLISLSLLALNASPDPIDHGLATAGWFAVGSMAVSQFFDFGLRIPANSIAATLIACAVIGRSTMIGFVYSESNRPREGALAPRARQRISQLWTHLPSGPLANLVLAALFAVALFSAIRFLDVEARADHTRRLAHHLPRGGQFNPDVAGGLKQWLQTHVDAHPDDTAAQLELSSLIVDSARYKVAKDATRDASTQNWHVNYRTLSPNTLRKIWYQAARRLPSAGSSSAPPAETAAREQGIAPAQRVPPTDVPPLFPIQHTAGESQLESASKDSPLAAEVLRQQRAEFGAQLHIARKHACDALRTCPLSDQAHAAVIVLDFAGGSQAQSERLIAQLIKLRSQNANSLVFAGRLAAQADLWQLAGQAWKSAMRLQPNVTGAVLASIGKDAPFSISEVLPDSPHAIAIAARQELIKPIPNKAMLASAVQSLTRSLPQERPERVARLRLIAQIHMIREQPRQAAEALAQAVALVPGDMEVRYQYVLALRTAGNINEARQQARAGRQIAPQDPRFDQLITAMSERSEE